MGVVVTATQCGCVGDGYILWAWWLWLLTVGVVVMATHCGCGSVVVMATHCECGGDGYSL